MGNMVYGRGKLNQKRIHSGKFPTVSWSWLQMLVSLACLPWPLGMWPMHIGKAHWHRVGHIHHKAIGRNPQNVLQCSWEGFDINPQPWGSSNLKSSSPNHFSFFSTYHLYLKHFPVWQNCLGSLWTGCRGGWNVCEGGEGVANRWKHSEPFLASVKVLLALCHVYTRFHWALIWDHLSKDLKILNTKHFVWRSNFRVLTVFGVFALRSNAMEKARQYAELALRMSRKQRAHILPCKGEVITQRGG